MSKQTEDKQVEILRELHAAIKRHNGFGFIFLHGVVRGLGTAFGATILVAVVTSLTVHFTGTHNMEGLMQSVMHAFTLE